MKVKDSAGSNGGEKGQITFGGSKGQAVELEYKPFSRESAKPEKLAFALRGFSN